MNAVYHNPDDYWYYNQKYNTKLTGNRSGCFYALIGVIILAIISLLLSSCRTVYVPVETVKTEYINKTDTFIQRDSIHYTDSVVIERSGDTVVIQKTKIIYKDRWQFSNTVDTIIKIDSIRVPYPVEKKLTSWEKAKINIVCIVVIVLVVVILIIMLRWLVKRRFRL